MPKLPKLRKRVWREIDALVIRHLPALNELRASPIPYEASLRVVVAVVDVDPKTLDGGKLRRATRKVLRSAVRAQHAIEAYNAVADTPRPIPEDLGTRAIYDRIKGEV